MNEIAGSTLERSPAPSQPRLRAKSRRLGVTLGAVAGVTAAVFVGLSATSGPAGLGPSAFAVTPAPHGDVSIHIVSTEASADEMTRQLQAKGLHIKITTDAASPALVGTWLYDGATDQVPQSVEQFISKQMEGYAATLEVPAIFPGTLTLGVGVSPRAGERINVAGLRNALAPGGPLACHSLSGAKPADAAKTLAALGYTIDFWTTREPIYPANATTQQSGVVPSPPADTRVTQVWVHDWRGRRWDDVDATREHNVIVQVQSPTAPSFPYTVWQGFAPTLRTGNPATAGC